MNSHLCKETRFLNLYLVAVVAAFATGLGFWYASRAAQSFVKFHDFSVYVNPIVWWVFTAAAAVFGVAAYLYRTSQVAYFRTRLAFTTVLIGLLSSLVVLVLGIK